MREYVKYVSPAPVLQHSQNTVKVLYLWKTIPDAGSPDTNVYK